MLAFRCDRCGFSAVVTSRLFDRYMADYAQHGTRPWQRQIRWPFRCHQQWMHPTAPTHSAS